MPIYSQTNQPIEVITPLGKDELLITSFTGEEGISRLFSFQIDMVADVKYSTKDIAFDKLLGKSITVRLNVEGKSRYFNGICIRFSQGEANTEFCSFQMEVAPTFWLWTKVARTRIFQQQTIPDILKTALTGLDVDYKLQGKYEPRNYCVQYRETDFNFVCRLMEEEGIFFFFTHANGEHKMVVADSTSSHLALPLGGELKFEKIRQENWGENRILMWQRQQELLTGTFTLWDHSFEMTGKNLEAKATITDAVKAGNTDHSLLAGKADAREVFDFPGNYAVRFDGVDAGGGDRDSDVSKILKDNERTVGIRQQQEAVCGVVVHGISTCRNVVSGHKFTLINHPNADGDYLLSTIKHQTGSAIDYRSSSSSFRYSNSFTAIPLVVPFRPQRLTPRPFVQGTQTATVVGPTDSEIFTDKYGRVKVKFHWDRDPKKDATSSCWVRVAQVWAGNRWGGSFWPRVGQEVVVTFIEGNPDSPIIVGSVYNDKQMPPYLGDGPDSNHPKDNKVSGIKSNTTLGGVGFNEWRFDDTKDKQEIFIHAERNLDTRVKNDTMEVVLHDRHLIVGAEKDGAKAGDQLEMVYQDKHLNVKRNQIEKIEGNLQFTVGKGDAADGGNVDIVIEKDKKELIEGADHLHVKGGQFVLVDSNQNITIKATKTEKIDADNNLQITGKRAEKVDGDQSLTVGGSQQEKVGTKHSVEAGTEIHIKAGTKFILEAGAQLTIKGPGGFVDIGPTGVTIQGTMVLINSGGAAGAGGGSSPASPASAKPPDDAAVAKPTKPTLADDSKTGGKS